MSIVLQYPQKRIVQVMVCRAIRKASLSYTVEEWEVSGRIFFCSCLSRIVSAALS